MKEKIHPKYSPTAIRCACGNVIETRSTKDNITIQICSKCHPYFTGEQKLIDSSGRIDKFKKKYGDNVGSTRKKKEPKKKKAKKSDKISPEQKKES